jgi:hypothetical protein
MPSSELVGTTLKLTTGREVTDGHSHFPTQWAVPQAIEPGSHLHPDYSWGRRGGRRCPRRTQPDDDNNDHWNGAT